MGVPNDPRAEMQRRTRLMRGLRWHMMGFFGIMVVLIVVNYLTTPDDPWFVLPMIAWGAPLAIHAAIAMELFGGPRGMK